jgi:DNA-binding CsgD family transcriptional regulator
MGDPDPAIASAIAEYNLTKKESDILRYLRDNASTEQIAAELYITENTVRSHVSRLLKKLDIARRQDVAEWLRERGAISTYLK